MRPRNCYRLQVERQGRTILRLATGIPEQRTREIKVRYPDATIRIIGRRVTWETAKKWEKGSR